MTAVAPAPPRRPAECDLVVAFVTEAVNEDDYTVVDEFLAPDVRDRSVTRLFADGRAGVIEALRQARRTWPDLYARILTMRVLATSAASTTIRIDLELTGTRAGRNLAPHPLDQVTVRWRQWHALTFVDGLVRDHHGWVDSPG
jgi:hypothetical protein